MSSRALNWDEEFDDGSENFILPEGDYFFEIIKFEVGHFDGSAKVDPCNRLEMLFRVETDDGRSVNVQENLLMTDSVKWRISAFLRCIGMKKKGENIRPNWNKIQGSRGKAHFKPRTYMNQRGEEREVNNVDRYLDYDPAWFAVPAQTQPQDWNYQPAQAAQPAQSYQPVQQGMGWMRNGDSDDELPF